MPLVPRRVGSYRRLLVAAIAVVVVLFGAPSAISYADPTNPDGPQNTLEDQLADIARKYTDAQARMVAAQQREKALQADLLASNNRLAVLQADIGQWASAEYRAGGAATLNALLSSTSPEDFMRRFTALHEIAQEQNAELDELHKVQQDFAATKADLDKQINIARNQAITLDQQRQAALRILNHASGGPSGVIIAAATASPAPRNSDGSFNDSCNQKDPTNPDGCLTAATLHAFNEVKKAGFNHYVHCWRQQSWGEHPKGRACDWAADPGGFGGVASGASRTYGNHLAGWLIGNADRLGVLYVIWFRQIWLPGIGWHAYTTESGSPSADHTNHVHMSIR